MSSQDVQAGLSVPNRKAGMEAKEKLLLARSVTNNVVPQNALAMSSEARSSLAGWLAGSWPGKGCAEKEKLQRCSSTLHTFFNLYFISFYYYYSLVTGTRLVTNLEQQRSRRILRDGFETVADV